MAYTPTVWASGDTIDATKLNKIEQGIASAGNMPLIKVNTNNVPGTAYVQFAYTTYNSNTGEYDVVKTFNSVSASDGSPSWAARVIPPIGNDTWYITNLQVPNNGLYLVYEYPTDGLTRSFSGNIGSSEVDVFFGSVGKGRIITGDCEITINY